MMLTTYQGEVQDEINENEKLGKIFDYLWIFGFSDQFQCKCETFSIELSILEQRTFAKDGIQAGIKLWALSTKFLESFEKIII